MIVNHTELFAKKWPIYDNDISYQNNYNVPKFTTYDMLQFPPSLVVSSYPS